MAHSAEKEVSFVFFLLFIHNIGMMMCCYVCLFVDGGRKTCLLLIIPHHLIFLQ